MITYLECKNCGGTFEMVEKNTNHLKCPYCGAQAFLTTVNNYNITNNYYNGNAVSHSAPTVEQTRTTSRQSDDIPKKAEQKEKNEGGILYWFIIVPITTALTFGLSQFVYYHIMQEASEMQDPVICWLYVILAVVSGVITTIIYGSCSKHRHCAVSIILSLLVFTIFTFLYTLVCMMWQAILPAAVIICVLIAIFNQ